MHMVIHCTLVGVRLRAERSEPKQILRCACSSYRNDGYMPLLRKFAQHQILLPPVVAECRPSAHQPPDHRPHPTAARGARDRNMRGTRQVSRKLCAFQTQPREKTAKHADNECMCTGRVKDE